MFEITLSEYEPTFRLSRNSIPTSLGDGRPGLDIFYEDVRFTFGDERNALNLAKQIVQFFEGDREEEPEVARLAVGETLDHPDDIRIGRI